MRRLSILSVCLTLWLQGFEIVFIPDYAPYAETIFSKGEVKDYWDASFWGKIKYLLNREGYTVYASTLNDISWRGDRIREWIEQEKGGEIQFVLWNQALSEDRLAQLDPKYWALLVFEPPSVYPAMHTEHYYKWFSKVITWDDEIIDGEKFCKFRYPVCLPMTRDLIPFSDRKLCCLMAANKKSKFTNELYSERLRAIRYFNQFPDQFDLYGPDWKKFGFAAYKGWVEDKVRAMKYYKFAICYENTKEVAGYITEKIFDCFQAGVVPVYWGAPNITDEVPEDCFIDRRKFVSYEELHHFLLSITEEEHGQYLSNIRRFLASEQAKAYSVDSSVVAIVNGLIGTNLTLQDLPK